MLEGTSVTVVLEQGQPWAEREQAFHEWMLDRAFLIVVLEQAQHCIAQELASHK